MDEQGRGLAGIIRAIATPKRLGHGALLAHAARSQLAGRRDRSPRAGRAGLAAPLGPARPRAPCRRTAPAAPVVAPSATERSRTLRNGRCARSRPFCWRCSRCRQRPPPAPATRAPRIRRRARQGPEGADVGRRDPRRRRLLPGRSRDRRVGARAVPGGPRPDAVRQALGHHHAVVRRVRRRRPLPVPRRARLRQRDRRRAGHGLLRGRVRAVLASATRRTGSSSWAGRRRCRARTARWARPGTPTSA